MSGRSPSLYCTLILITMHSHQSYPNITTVIHGYEYSTTVDNSTIETYRNRGLGKIKMYISILYNIIHCHARVFYEKKKNEPRPSEHPSVVGGKNKHRLHGKLGIQLSFQSLLHYIYRGYCD